MSLNNSLLLKDNFTKYNNNNDEGYKNNVYYI